MRLTATGCIYDNISGGGHACNRRSRGGWRFHATVYDGGDGDGCGVGMW
jgi:hypothetical protein